MALTQITEKGIKDGEIVNADVNASAAIAKSKLAGLDIVNADINASADIAGSKIADDTITEAKLDIHAAPTGTDKFLGYTSNGMEWATVPAGYTHPNHSGEVTSTADGAQVVADDVIDEANLKADNSPTNDYVLTAKSSAAGGLTWAAASGSSADDCIWKNSLTISNAHTIAATEGAHSVGPITLNATVTLNGRWVIS